MRRTLFITLVSVMLLPVAAIEVGADQVHFTRALTTREQIPTRADLLRLDPQAEQTLQALVTNTATRPLVRSRAIGVLQFFPSKATAAALLGVIKGASHPRAKGLELMDLGRALISYAAVVGPEALPRIEPFLAHKNPDVRLEAARALSRSRSPAALPLLSGRLKVETTPFVRVKLKRLCDRLQHAMK